MKIVLMKVGGKWCPPCRALDRAETLEKFQAKHPDVRIEVHDDPSEDGEPVRGTERWSAFADKWKVKNLPTLIWTYDGKELLRSYDVSARGIEAQYDRAARKVESL